MKKLNQILSTTVGVLLLTMVIEYFQKGNLMDYNYIKYLTIGILLGIGIMGYKSFRSNSETSK